MHKLVIVIFATVGYMAVAAKQESCKCTGPHEYFACGSACDTECATLHQTCPIVNIKCNEMCYCEDGYARNAKHVCVPIDQCS